MTKVFARCFSDFGLAALEKRPGWWQDLLDARFEDAGGRERPLFLAVRENYLNAYVEGQSISKIEFEAKEPPALRAAIHHKYVLDRAEGQRLLCFDGSKVGDVDYGGPAMLRHWIEKARPYAGNEKKGVAVIADNNPHVIDVEMALPGHASRIDMVALERHGDAIRIAFYEAKRFENKSLVSKAKPKVLEQLEKYADWLREDGRDRLLAACYRRACQVLIALRGMQGHKVHMLVSEAAKEGSNLIIDPAPRLVIFDYDLSDLYANWTNIHKPKLESAGLHGIRLIMAPLAAGISLPNGSTTSSALTAAALVLFGTAFFRAGLLHYG